MRLSLKKDREEADILIVALISNFNRRLQPLLLEKKANTMVTKKNQNRKMYSLFMNSNLLQQKLLIGCGLRVPRLDITSISPLWIPLGPLDDP